MILLQILMSLLFYFYLSLLLLHFLYIFFLHLVVSKLPHYINTLIQMLIISIQQRNFIYQMIFNQDIFQFICLTLKMGNSCASCLQSCCHKCGQSCCQYCRKCCLQCCFNCCRQCCCSCCRKIWGKCCCQCCRDCCRRQQCCQCCRQCCLQKTTDENVPLFQQNIQNFSNQQGSVDDEVKINSETDKRKKLEQNYDKILEKLIRQKQEKTKNYIQNIEKLFTKQNCLAKIAQDKRNKVIFLGNSYVGKSSLINKLYQLNLTTEKSQSSFGYEKVHTIGKTIDIYDSQEQNKNNSYQQFKLWEGLNYYKIVFILYQNTLKTSKTMIECLCKPKQRVYKVYFVCTKCDIWGDSNNKTIDEGIKQQRKYLKQIGISNVGKIRFFKSSAREDSFEGGENENYKIVNLISQLEEDYS